MNELWIIFNDPDGRERRVLVDRPRFAIGRHTENVLCIADERLSRFHAVIEQRNNEYFISDLGSVNGTEVNGVKIAGSRKILPGEKVSFGGFDVDLEFVPLVSDTPVSTETKDDETSQPEPPTHVEPVSVPRAEGGFPKAFFIIGPVFASLILCALGLVLYFSGGTTANVRNSNFVYSDDPEISGRDRTNRSTVNGTPTDGSANTLQTQISPQANAPPSNTSANDYSTSSDTGKTEQNAAMFLRHAAQNDTKAFITGQQAKLVNERIRSLAGSSSLADNIASAKKSAVQIKSFAASKNLKPQFLAVAALTKLGPSRGDVFQTAQSMAEVLSKLETQVGTERGEDCLLMMAAYDQGTAGDFMKMRNMLQDLATKAPDSSRVIRTIWYLKQNGKISDAQFEFALRFLAIGAITQNPKDYGINAEALVF